MSKMVWFVGIMIGCCCSVRYLTSTGCRYLSNAGEQHKRELTFAWLFFYITIFFQAGLPFLAKPCARLSA